LKFVAMPLLHNEDYQWNNPLASFPTGLCRQRSGHEWTVNSPLHETRTMNLSLLHCVCHWGK